MVIESIIKLQGEEDLLNIEQRQMRGQTNCAIVKVQNYICNGLKIMNRTTSMPKSVNKGQYFYLETCFYPILFQK